MIPANQDNRLRQVVLPLVLFAGDLVVCFAGLCLGYWLRYETRLERLGIPVPHATFSLYLPLILTGVLLLAATFAQLGLYDQKLLLRRYQALATILKAAFFWLVAYLGISLVLKFQPPISRLFVVVAVVLVVALLWIWRSVFYSLISRGRTLERVQLRVAVFGWSEEAGNLIEHIRGQPAHPLRIVGIVKAPDAPTSRDDLPALVLGSLDNIEETMRTHRIDVLLLSRADLPRPLLQAVTGACERCYVELKAIPGVFEVFVSGLRLQTIGRIPLLGVEELPMQRLLNRMLKRAIDIVGALAGVIISLPVIAFLAVLVKRESSGPVLFMQERIGSNHRRFTMLKLRSMVAGSEASDHLAQSTSPNDPRLSRIGRTMRRWNLDELPQFWNVLLGDMSLVGPRPERPHHVDHLAEEIPHYLPRHLVKPGMTGWAQVNGQRGEGDLAKRIQYDIYYIENWSLWLDLQILLLTFVRWKAPA
jgi:exopolysaccharide biosynthesis polyprenyl glycosylphosphotransferase